MPKKQVPIDLLRLLSNGEFQSGEAIGSVLGVSRAAVWKQLQKIEELGVRLESVKGKGYRLEEPINLLDQAHLSDALAPRLTVDVYSSIDSTNAEVLRRFATTTGKGLVVLAESQDAGRGRRGRVWQSPFAQNLYFSMGWCFEGGAAALEGLSLVVGVSLVEALLALGLEQARLKWPNDVLVDGRKLAGILLEITGDPTGLCKVVIGIGVNANMVNAGGSIDQPWVSIRQVLGGMVDRNQLTILLAEKLLANLYIFEQHGFAAFAGTWHELDAFLHQEVIVTQGERRIIGTAAGVNQAGELRLDIDGVIQHFNGGEVSLRRKLC